MNMKLQDVIYGANCPDSIKAYGDKYELEFESDEMARKDWGVSRKVMFNGSVCFCKTLDLAAMPKASLRALAETEEAIILGSTRADLYVPGIAVVKEFQLTQPETSEQDDQQCTACSPEPAAAGISPAAAATNGAAAPELLPTTTCCPTCGCQLPAPELPGVPQRELVRMHLLSQWTEGVTITQLLEQGRTFSEDQAALEVILPQLWAVYEHRKQGLVNMDIKPCNIMVPADGHMGVGIDVGSVVPLSMIRRGVFYWTKGFAGPEVHSSKVPNSVAAEKNDIWAIGSTLHSVVEGHDAHDDADHSSWGEMTLQELRSGTLSNASKLRRTLSTALLSIDSTDLSMCNAAGSSCTSLSSLVPSEQADQPSSQRSSPARRPPQGTSGGGAAAAQGSPVPTPVPDVLLSPAPSTATRSNEYCDFLERCFQMDPQKRASAADLMVHPLMRRAIRHCVKDLQHTRQEVDVLRQQVHDLQERCKQLELHHHHVLPDHYHVHQK